MPREEYRTITVKKKTFKRFMRIKKKSGLQNSEFVDSLLGED